MYVCMYVWPAPTPTLPQYDIDGPRFDPSITPLLTLNYHNTFRIELLSSMTVVICQRVFVLTRPYSSFE